jgi:Tol biopolymer transport system component
MLVFHGHVGQESAVMVSDDSGSNARVLVQGLGYLDGPKWSPDGSRIAFVGRFGNGDMQLWTVKSDGTDLTKISTNGVGEHISWSPSGTEIVYVHYNYSEITCSGGNFSNGTIWRVNPTTQISHQITFNTGVECP